MKNNKKLIKEVGVNGFALFAMFFGAGNLIFPPTLGLLSGRQWVIAFLGFFIMDVGLAVLSVFVTSKQNGDLTKFTGKLGAGPGNILMVLVALCLGPLVGIPRTGAVTYSMGIQPLIGYDEEAVLALPIFSVVFFAIVLLLTIRPGKVVDIVGAYMTPILLFCLLLINIVGIITATSGAGDVLVESPIKTGVINGYQTMDGMGAILVAGILIHSLKEKHDEGSSKKIISMSNILAALLLLIVYGGLTFVGAAWGQPMAEWFMSGNVDQADLLTAVVYQILGKPGVYVMAVVTLLACMTTAIGLTSAVAKYFSDITKQKVSYKTFSILICACSALLCNIGLSYILKFAQPILTILYPAVITLLVMSMCERWVPQRLPSVLGVIVAVLIGLLTVLCDTAGITAFGFIHCLPLDSVGLGFVVPTLCAVLIGIGICRIKGKKEITGIKK